jgi:hypothetical protein
LSKGVEPVFKERLADGFALGTKTFRERVRQAGKDGREIAGTRKLRPLVSLGHVVGVVERLRDEKRLLFMTRHGDWARPLLLWAARRCTGMTLREIGMAVGGMDYTAVAMAVKRCEQKAKKDANLRRLMKQAMHECEM